MAPKTSTKLDRQLTQARKRIASLFVAQCEHGAQAKTLEQPDAAACGQFIGQKALDIGQRGIHGTAAALRALSEHGSSDAIEAVKRIVHYVEERESIEQNLKTTNEEKQRVKKKITLDLANVVKASELLYALSFVRAGWVSTQSLIKKLASSLEGGMVRERGWSYFLDESSTEIEAIPTAYAVRALSAIGRDVSAPVDYLAAQLQIARPSEASSLDTTTKVLIIFALVFPGNGESSQLARCEKTFESLWPMLESMLARDDLEQNIEYWRESTTALYLRVPWQLYTLALAAKLKRGKRFGSAAVQGRLRAILREVLNGGFAYPYSGKHVSARTNGVLYEILGLLQVHRPSAFRYRLRYWVDQLRNVLSTHWVAWGGFVAAFAIVVYSIWSWSQEDGAKVSALAPNLLSALFVWLLSLRKSRS